MKKIEKYLLVILFTFFIINVFIFCSSDGSDDSTLLTIPNNTNNYTTESYQPLSLDLSTISLSMSNMTVSSSDSDYYNAYCDDQGFYIIVKKFYNGNACLGTMLEPIATSSKNNTLIVNIVTPTSTTACTNSGVLNFTGFLTGFYSGMYTLNVSVDGALVSTYNQWCGQ